MTDTKQDMAAVAAEVAAEARERREQLLAKKEAKEGGGRRQDTIKARQAANAEIMQKLEGAGQLQSLSSMVGEQPRGTADDVPTVPEVAAKRQQKRGRRQAIQQDARTRAEILGHQGSEELRQAGVDALRRLQMGAEAEDDVEDEPAVPAPQAAAQAPAPTDGLGDLVAALRGERPLGPAPLPVEHKEALLALQVPEAMIREWAKSDPNGLATFAATQYEARRKREDAFASRDRQIATLHDRFRALEQAVGLVGEPTPPRRGGAEPGNAGDALRAALGEDDAAPSSAASAPDVRALIEAEVRKLTAPVLERHAQEERQRLQSQVHAARTDLGKSWPGLLDEATFSQRVAPRFLELYQAGVSGRDVRSLMELAAFAGLGGTTRASDVTDPTPPRNAPGTRQGRAPHIASLTPHEAGLKAINELLRSGDVKRSREYASELGAAVRST